MPYTLSMGLLWFTLAALLGIVIGWLMRSVVAKRQIERARSNHLDNVELERLRRRVAELEPSVVERDRLRDELEACRSAVTEHAPAGAVLDVAADEVTADEVTADEVAHDVAVVRTPSETEAGATTSPARVEHGVTTVVDLTEAAGVFGTTIELDDLTLIEGIGPKIADLCDGIGIQTWRDLAQTEVSLLRTMLHDAGARFRSHDPSTWPEQAALLADGRWAEFRAYTERRGEDRTVG
jgi:predicted flap endonuclease-1-like 5' DNA nuclease